MAWVGLRPESGCCEAGQRPMPGTIRRRKFGILYEHQLPRPWGPDDEHRLLVDALEQVELADRVGIDYLWEVEHHLLSSKFAPTSCG